MPIALSVVIPVLNDSITPQLLCEQFAECVPKDVRYEIIFVNDGNLNNAVFSALEALRSRPEVRVVHLSKRFGQHVAVAAGMKNSRGEYLLSMDCDLQYLPKDCYRMYEWSRKNGHDAVFSLVPKNAHSAFRALASRAYYFALTALGTPSRGDLGSAYVITRHVAQGLLRTHDRYRMTMSLISWLGGDLAYFELPHYPRRFGSSGYTFTKLLAHALNGVTSFSSRPLYLAFALSLGFAALVVLVVLGLSYMRFVLGRHFPLGWPTTIVVTLSSASLVLGCLGIIGLYLAKLFENSNGRPLYFVRKDATDTPVLFEDQAEP